MVDPTYPSSGAIFGTTSRAVQMYLIIVKGYLKLEKTIFGIDLFGKTKTVETGDTIYAIITKQFDCWQICYLLFPYWLVSADLGNGCCHLSVPWILLLHINVAIWVAVGVAQGIWGLNNSSADLMHMMRYCVATFKSKLKTFTFARAFDLRDWCVNEGYLL